MRKKAKQQAPSQPATVRPNGEQPVIIAAKNLTKIYGKKSMAFKALDNINLEIRRGESVAIIGKSGSGKSTLMHCLALLDKPTKGQVYIGSHSATKLKNRRINRLRNKNFGFVFQQFFMNARDSVISNVELPLKIAGIKRREQKRRAMEALKIVELENKAKQRANDLSGGQKQRVCIARAIVHDPSVIFADEPTGNLDSVTGARVEDLLMRMNKEKNITLIIVTHDEDLAARCSRQIHIKDGRIESESATVSNTKNARPAVATAKGGRK